MNILWGSFFTNCIPFVFYVYMTTTNAWCSSQLFYIKLSFDRRPIMLQWRVSSKWSTGNFLVIKIFKMLSGIWKYLCTKITNLIFCTKENFPTYCSALLTVHLEENKQRWICRKTKSVVVSKYIFHMNWKFITQPNEITYKSVMQLYTTIKSCKL